MSAQAVNRRLTKAFIDQLPVELVLTPRRKERTSAGGFKWEDFDPRAPQVMTLIEPTAIPRPEVTVDGIVRVVEFTLLAEHDAKLAKYDTFTYQGKEWEVVEMFHENGYERRALVTARG